MNSQNNLEKHQDNYDFKKDKLINELYDNCQIIKSIMDNFNDKKNDDVKTSYKNLKNMRHIMNIKEK